MSATGTILQVQSPPIQNPDQSFTISLSDGTTRYWPESMGTPPACGAEWVIDTAINDEGPVVLYPSSHFVAPVVTLETVLDHPGVNIISVTTTSGLVIPASDFTAPVTIQFMPVSAPTASVTPAN